MTDGEQLEIIAGKFNDALHKLRWLQYTEMPRVYKDALKEAMALSCFDWVFPDGNVPHEFPHCEKQSCFCILYALACLIFSFKFSNSNIKFCQFHLFINFFLTSLQFPAS